MLLWAQGYEDIVLFHALKDVENGFYVDVGANSPWDCSVTKLFYEHGWHGINVEPLEEHYRMLCEDRPRDVCVLAGAGSQEAEQELTVDDGCSSFDLDVRGRMECKGRNLECRKIRIRKLDSILQENLTKPAQDIHFFKIDVEGFEREVLEGVSLSKYRPWIITLEATDPITQAPNHQKWESILLSNGYEFAHEQFVNRYYVASERRELKTRFVGEDALNHDYDLYFVSHSFPRILAPISAGQLIRTTVLEIGSRVKRTLIGA